MCDVCGDVQHQPRLTRRNFLRTGTLAALAPWTPEVARAADPPAPGASPPPNAITPAAALKRLMEGNARYAANTPNERDFSSGRAARAQAQYPIGAILGCADSRVAPELTFDQAPGDLFVVRVAGNIVTPDLLASLEYGVQFLGAPLIIVLGHSGCGAVSAAVDVFLNPADYLSLARVHSLRGILDRLLVVVQASARKLTQAFGADVAQRAGYRAALIEAAIVTNAALTAHEIEQAIGGDAPGSVQTAYGVYLLESRNVWTPQQDQTGAAGLAAAPRDAADFDRLSDAVVQSPRIAALLG